MLQIPVICSSITETTALGAAYLAGLAVRFWKSKDEFKLLKKDGKAFIPKMPQARAKKLRERWSEAVKRAID